MKGASRLDKVEWEEFTSNIATLGPLSEQLLHDLLTTNADEEADLLQYDKIILAPVRALTPPTGPTTATALVNVRRGQQFFRQSILSAYGLRCCISGINAPGLLVASHIKPWQEFPDERLNPRNGLCLSSLHDAALDKGLIALDEGMRVVLSDRLRSYMPQRALEENFVPYEGVAIRLPDRLAEPSTEFIRYHREFVFQA